MLSAEDCGAKFHMNASTRLGGFKILKDVARISLILTTEGENLPAKFFQIIAGEKINLPYINCLYNGNDWGLNIMVDAANEARTSQLIDGMFGRILTHDPKSAILSIFPHKKDPEITGSLLELLGQEMVEPDALANSPSAISVVLKEEFLKRASNGLFGPFNFSAYRTPSEWKLTQKGKEQLYKEVVASYQEKRPKVYGLECLEGQELLQIELDRSNFGYTGKVFKEFARLNMPLTFLATNPCQEEGKEKLVFCLTRSENCYYNNRINEIVPSTDIGCISPVAIFSMNGPHFGERYGIASEILTAFEHHKIDLVGLSCTIASVTGVVPDHQLDSTIQAIREYFEVPSITKRDGFS